MRKLLVPMMVIALYGDTRAIEDAIKRDNDTARELHDAGRYGEAGAVYRRAIQNAARPQIAPSTHVRVRLNLVALHLESGDVGSARRELHATAEVEGAASMPDLHCATGTLHLLEGNLSAAAKAFERALAMLPQDSRDEQHASLLENLASVRIKQGRLEKARDQLLASLALLERGSRTEVQRVRTLGSLSTVEYLRHDFMAAEKAGARALSLAEARFGGESPIVADLLANYAMVLERLRRGKEAKSYRARANSLRSSVDATVPAVVDMSELRVSGSNARVRVR